MAHADLVIADSGLGPQQARTLEDKAGMRVPDRTALILGVFADHACTARATLQVELARSPTRNPPTLLGHRAVPG